MKHRAQQLIWVAVVVCSLSLEVGCGNEKLANLKNISEYGINDKNIRRYLHSELGCRPIPSGINCENYHKTPTSKSREGVDLENVLNLKSIAEMELKNSPFHFVNFPDFPQSLGLDFIFAKNTVNHLQRSSYAFKGMNYRVNASQISLADPYLYLHNDNPADLPEVPTEEWEAIKNNFYAINDSSRDNNSALRGNLEKLDFWSPFGSNDRRSLMRRRVKKLYCETFKDSETPLIYGLALQLEGDTTAHCMDGLDQQITHAETIILGRSSGRLLNLGMALSKIFSDYKAQFIAHHDQFGQGSEEQIYVPQAVQRRMQLILGLKGPLTSLEFPGFARLNQQELSPSEVIKRFYQGDATFADHYKKSSRTKNSTVYEGFRKGFSPQLMIALLQQAVRRAYPPDNALADSTSGEKLPFDFIYEQLKTNRNRPHAPFGPLFDKLQRFVSAEENSHAGQESQESTGDYTSYLHIEANSGIQYLSPFWIRLLIYYGYLEEVSAPQ